MKKRNILIILLIILISLTLFLIIFVNKNKNIEYSEEKINLIIEYINNSTKTYNGLHSNFNYNTIIDINTLEEIEINKMVTSILVSTKGNNTSYDYDKCNECYKYFSKYDNIKFYSKEDIKEIIELLFSKEINKITQEDYASYNILYYNKDIDMYYTNISNTDNINQIFELKEYNKENNKITIDYYFANILHNEENTISLYDINNNLIEELISSDDNYYQYLEKMNIIRYSLKKYKNKYILDKIILIK